LELNYYQILGISVRASQAEIKSAYKLLARKFHPDVNQGSSDSEERFKKILEAYQTLSDEKKRKRYDLNLFFTAVGSSNSNPAPDMAYRNVPQTPREREEERYRNRRSARESYRAFSGPAENRKFTPNVIAIALLVVSSFVMISYWLGHVMNRHMAEKSLKNGDFQIALEYDDEYAEAYYARYLFFAVRNAPPKRLLSDLNLAIQFADEPRADWFLARARLHVRMNEGEKALIDFSSAIKTGPKIDSVWLASGDFHAFQMNQTEIALACYDTALLLRKNYYPALSGKATMLFRLKRFPQAIECLSNCIRSGRADREIFYMRGCALLAVDQPTQACEDLNQALNMGFVEALNLVNKYCSE
jgi:curved DNA-binding protein CbpA